MTVQCCVCEKIRQDGDWVGSYRLNTPVQGPISHGYCPECLEKAMEEIRGFQAPVPAATAAQCKPLAWAMGA